MANKTTISPQFVEKIDRNELLQVSSWVIKDLRSRLAVDRFREREGDKTKLQYLRVLVAAEQAHNAILKDAEMGELKQRLEILEGLQNDHKNH